MNRRSFVWRAGGAVVMIAGVALTSLENGGSGAAVTLIGFVMAIAGLALVIEGRRVPAAFRIERSRHRHLPDAIHAARRTRAGRP